jgi:hypothetical protein
MARQPRHKRRDSGAASSSRGDDDDAAPRSSGKKDIPAWKMWFEEAWHGWMKSVSGLAVLALAYIAYSQNWVSDRTGGPIVVALVIGGIVAMAAIPVVPQLDKRPAKIAFGAFLLVWAGSTAYPSLHIAIPRKPLIEKRLGDTKDHLTETLALTGESGPYEILVDGRLKGQRGDVEARYKFTFTGEGNTTEEVSGSLSRTQHRERVGRRGGTSMVEFDHTENIHRLELVRGSELKVALEGADEQVEEGFILKILRGGPNPLWFLAVAAFSVLVALIYDYRLAAPKVKTYLTVSASITLVFTYLFSTRATPAWLVKPAIEAIAIGVFAGGAGGWVVSAIVKSFKPKPKLRPSKA